MKSSRKARLWYAVLLFLTGFQAIVANLGLTVMLTSEPPWAPPGGNAGPSPEAFGGVWNSIQFALLIAAAFSLLLLLLVLCPPDAVKPADHRRCSKG